LTGVGVAKAAEALSDSDDEDGIDQSAHGKPPKGVRMDVDTIKDIFWEFI
jgi:hypothetical protein